MKEISFYIHIPYCIKKCAYCDFLSAPDFETAPEYFAALSAEINAFETAAKVRSVFVGGGTPSAVKPEYTEKILSDISRKFSLTQNCEITLESNPGTLDKEKLRLYRSLGVNRLSMGVQSLDDRLLNVLGRIHDSKTAMRSFSLAKEYFDNINLDLMFALPTQSFGDWKSTLEQAVRFEPTHISAYSLIIEEGTPFFDKYEPVDEELDRDMYWFARDFLSENGYMQYEISNFAKAGRECRHNLVYWQGGDYKGFGLGAASLLNNERLKNTENMHDYLNGITVCETERLDKTEQMQEFVLLGLRCMCGISAAEFKNRFGRDIFECFGSIFARHESTGLLEISGDNIRLTRRGIDLSNIVFVDFV